MYGEENDYEASHYATFSTPLDPNIFLSILLSNIYNLFCPLM
jgi:hypothetical protein